MDRRPSWKKRFHSWLATLAIVTALTLAVPMTSLAQWSGWVRLGSGIKEEPECVSWGANRIDCFVRGMDDALHTIAWDGHTWSGWMSLGGGIKNRPSCVSWGA